MIELLLQAERALSVGLLDRAETLYEQVARADPRNSIAVVGLARVTLDRGDEHGALDIARRALAIDPENDAARRMVARLEEVIDYRVDAEAALAVVETAVATEPEAAEATEPEAAEAAEDLETGTEREAETDGAAEPAAATEPEPAAATEPEAVAVTAEPEADVAAEPAAATEPDPAAAAEPEPIPTPLPTRRRSFLDRLFRRR